MKKSLLISCFICIWSIHLSAQVNPQDSAALVDFFNSTNGPSWEEGVWKLDRPVSEWQGVTITDGRVTGLEISLSAGGSIPETFGNLTAMEWFNIETYSPASAQLPESIGNLSNLKSIEVYSSGSSTDTYNNHIPAGIENLTHLERLTLDGVGLSGSLPEWISTLSNLQGLNLGRNHLSGNLPADFDNLTQLKRLDLAGSAISGTLNFLDNMTQMEDLRLQNCNFNGSIPVSIGNLTKFRILILSGNQLSGAVPAAICSLPELEALFLDNNNFTFDGMACVVTAGGEYEPQRAIALTDKNPVLSVTAGGNLADNTYTWYKDGVALPAISGDSILTVNASGDYYVTVTNSTVPGLTLQSGTVTISSVLTLQQRDSLALVDIYNTCAGVDLSSYTNWLVPGKPISEWSGVDVDGNGRVQSLALMFSSGGNSLPETFGNLTAMEWFHIETYSPASAQLPESIGNLSNLKSIEVYSSGSSTDTYNNHIPAGIENLTHLEGLTLNGVGLSGSLPEWISTLSNLQGLNLGNNHLSGNLPADFDNLTQLKSLNLAGNAISGTLNFLGNMTQMEELQLQYCNFNGSIPVSIGNLTKFRILILSGNQLSGAVPAAICSLPELEALFLDNNNFNFDGMACVVTAGGEYEPQRAIALTDKNPVLSVTAGGNLADNTYTWYKDGVALPAISGDSTLTVAETGVYHVEITNSTVPGLTLVSTNVTINSILPLNWVDVQASACNNGVCLAWKTDMEQNTAYFEVEVSANGVQFNKVGNNVLAYNTPGLHTYNSIDYQPKEGVNYYRIKQVDKDGIYKYSKIVKVTVSGSPDILVAPNPASNFIILKGLGKADRVSIYNANGQLVKTWQRIAATGSQQFNIADLANGVYVIRIIQQEQQKVLRFVKH